MKFTFIILTLASTIVFANENKSGQGIFSLSGVVLGRTTLAQATGEGCAKGRGNFCIKVGTTFHHNPSTDTFFTVVKKASEPAQWPDKWHNMGLKTSLSSREARDWMEGVGFEPGREGDTLVGTMVTEKRFLRIAIKYTGSKIDEVSLLSTPRPQYVRPRGL